MRNIKSFCPDIIKNIEVIDKKEDNNMKLIGIYHCTLLGYNKVCPIKVSSYEAAEVFMENGLNNFIENVRELRKNENYNNSNDIEYLNYVESCYWELIQAEDFYLDFYMLDLNNENDWQDIEKK